MDKQATVIIPSNENSKAGGLYLGGYKASINRDFLQSQRMTHILNVAAGLVNFFGPKYEVRKLLAHFHKVRITLNTLIYD